MTKKTFDFADEIHKQMASTRTAVVMYGGPPADDYWRPVPAMPFVPLPPSAPPALFTPGPSAAELELMQEITKLKVDLSRAAAEIERLKKAISALVET